MKALINKYIKVRVLVVATALIAVSCDLDEVHPSGATANAVWSSPEGFITLVNAAYSEQRQMFGKIDGPFNYEMGTDLWFNKSLDGYAKELSKYENFTPSTGNPNKKGWSVPWKAINLCNAGINRIDDAGYDDDAEKNARLGELRFLRGYYYWYLVESFGPIMLRTTETSEPLLRAEKSTVEEVYELIIDDLTFAKNHLPLDQGAQYSRASKKSAMGFLARAYLSRAYYGDADTYFGLAQQICDSIILEKDELGIALWDSYSDLWDPANNTNNTEALYIVSNSNDPSLNFDGNANRLHRWFMMRYDNYPGLELSLEYGETGDRRFAPTLALLDYFDESMDARYDASFREAWLCNTEEPFVWDSTTVEQFGKDYSIVGDTVFPGDTALVVTKESLSGEGTLPYVAIDRDSVYNTSGNNALVSAEDFVQLKKFEDPTRAEAAQVYSYHDIFVLRFAEIYLIAAEAAYQAGDPGAAATYINVLRTRAAIKTPVDMTEAMQIDASDVDVEFILEERARELAGEHIRWFDVKRVYQNEPSQFVTFITDRNPNITEVKEHHILRPIPQEEIDALLNGEEFGQNDGYNN